MNNADSCSYSVRIVFCILYCNRSVIRDLRLGVCRRIIKRVGVTYKNGIASIDIIFVNTCTLDETLHLVAQTHISRPIKHKCAQEKYGAISSQW